MFALFKVVKITIIKFNGRKPINMPIKNFHRHLHDNCRVYIRFKKSSAKINGKKTVLLEFVTPKGVFYKFIPRQYFELLKKHPESIFGILQDVLNSDVYESYLDDFIKIDQQLSLNGKIVNLHSSLIN